MNDDLKLHEYVLKLKQLKRKGWELRGIPNVESVADHSYSVIFLAMVMAERLQLNVEKCLKLAVVHDLAESVTKDITPHDNVSDDEKLKLEEQAIKKIVDETGFTFIQELAEEYNENNTKEANLVRDMDKIEMIIQANDYMKKYPNKNLNEFYDYVKDRLELEESKVLFKEITK